MPSECEFMYFLTMILPLLVLVVKLDYVYSLGDLLVGSPKFRREVLVLGEAILELQDCRLIVEMELWFESLLVPIKHSTVDIHDITVAV